MEELIDVLDENGNKTGKINTRKAVHEKGLFHRIVVIAIIDKEGRVLMQQRAMEKKSNPGKWDITVAGHVSAGQNSKEAAIREVSEEIGINIKGEELEYICTFKSGGKLSENYISNHINDFYIVRKENINLNDITMQTSEVQDVKLCNKNEIEKLILNKKVVKRDKAYEELFRYLR